MVGQTLIIESFTYKSLSVYLIARRYSGSDEEPVGAECLGKLLHPGGETSLVRIRSYTILKNSIPIK